MADDREKRRAGRDREIEAFVRAQSDVSDGGAMAQGDVGRFWSALDDGVSDPAIQAMLADARSRVVRDANVIPFRRRQTLLIVAALAASLVAVVGIESWFAMRSDMVQQDAPTRIMANGAAAPRSFRLADGSTVTLDGRSAIALPAWTDERRTVALTRGRAFFKVVHDGARPFVVTAAGSRITDLGTAFSVETDRAATVVTLVEGAVRVLPARARAAIDLKPDDALTMTGAGDYSVTRVDAAAQNEWLNGRISFDNQPAAVVLARMNRYFEQDITLSDAQQGRTPISGTFQLDDRDDVVRALSQLGIKVVSLRQ